jgi:hypothetical protein
MKFWFAYSSAGKKNLTGWQNDYVIKKGDVREASGSFREKVPVPFLSFAGDLTYAKNRSLRIG